MTQGEHMRKARKDAGLSREKLRDLSGITVLTIRNSETNRVSPTLYTMIRLADALKISIDEYIGRTIKQ